MDPLVHGYYPPILRNLLKGRLPNLTENDSKSLKGSFDFIGLNHYTTHWSQNLLNGSMFPQYDVEMYDAKVAISCTSPHLIWHSIFQRVKTEELGHWMSKYSLIENAYPRLYILRGDVGIYMGRVWCYFQPVSVSLLVHGLIYGIMCVGVHWQQ